MAERAENSFDQAFDEHDDARLKAALSDVAVPTGLHLRLKSALRSHSRLTHAEDSQSTSSAPLELRGATNHRATPSVDRAASSVDTEQLVGSRMESQLRSAPDATLTEATDIGWRRRSIIALALAAGICGFAFLASRWTGPAEPTWLARQCNFILEKMEPENPASWQPIDQADSSIPSSVKSQLARVAFVGQRPLAAFSQKFGGSVYRIDAGDGRTVVLMRMQALPAVRGLTSRFEILSTPSGGFSLAAMTIGKETFVLAAACTDQQMMNYIRRPALT